MSSCVCACYLAPVSSVPSRPHCAHPPTAPRACVPVVCVAGLPAPDVVYFLDLAVEDAMKRGQFGEERYEKEAMQRIVRKNFHALRQPNWKLIDATESMEKIHNFLCARAHANSRLCCFVCRSCCACTCLGVLRGRSRKGAAW